jgi:hypothetical protein
MKQDYTIQNSNDLLSFILSQASSQEKNWFGFRQQRIAGIDVAYKIAILHADTMSPTQVVDYVTELNNAIYHKIIATKDKT